MKHKLLKLFSTIVILYKIATLIVAIIILIKEIKQIKTTENPNENP
jgi:hypothetical protein